MDNRVEFLEPPDIDSLEPPDIDSRMALKCKEASSQIFFVLGRRAATACVCTRKIS